MEKSTAISIIGSRNLVTQEGKFTAKIENVSPYEKETPVGRQVAIANLNLMTKYHRDNAKKLAAQGEYQEAVNQKMSFGILENSYMPSKGEVVDVIVIEKENRDGIPSLFINSIIPKKAEKLSKVDFSFDDEVEGIEIAEEIPAFTTAAKAKA